MLFQGLQTIGVAVLLMLAVLAILAVVLCFVFYRKIKTTQATEPSPTPEHIVIINKGKEHLKRIVELSKTIEDPAIAKLVTELGLTTQHIYKNLASDLRDMSIICNFVDYHAPKCIELIEEYLQVVAQPASSARDESLIACLKVLTEMKHTFEAFFLKCLENDTAELNVLSETMLRIGRIERPVLLEPTATTPTTS